MATVPRPTADDPLLCEGDERDQYVESHGWLLCSACTRVLKQKGAHRVRSRTTMSMDRTRDVLLAAGIPPA